MAYTTFSQNKNDQLKEPMFFGQNVNVARYDQQKYETFEKLIEKQLSFFWRPEERQLFFDQFFKYFVFLLVITGDIYRLTKKHRLFQRVVFGFGKGAV